VLRRSHGKIWRKCKKIKGNTLPELIRNSKTTIMRSAGYVARVSKIKNMLRFSLKLYVEDAAWFSFGQINT
jgi:hypothetical protein